MAAMTGINFSLWRTSIAFLLLVYGMRSRGVQCFVPFGTTHQHRSPLAFRTHGRTSRIAESSSSSSLNESGDSSTVPTKDDNNNDDDDNNNNRKNDTPAAQKVVVIGAGWGGLSAAYWIAKQNQQPVEVTVVDAAPRVGGLVRDGFTSIKGQRKAEAGQHGFWDQYYNIFQLMEDELNILDQVLTGYAEQGQYSRAGGLEAVWPIYRDQVPRLPTGLAQAAYTKFLNLPLVDRLTAFPLVLAFSEFDDSAQAWKKYDAISFRDLCTRLGVSRRCYDEAFEPMILTGLFAPGAQVSAAAALGMAYFFVLSNQNAFDVRWCKGNIGELIFDPWIQKMESLDQHPVKFQTSTRVVGFEMDESGHTITRVNCMTQSTPSQPSSSSLTLDADVVVFAVGASALNAMVRNSNSSLRSLPEFRRFANLRGTSVLATRLYLDRHVPTPYTANACWGFDEGVGMTFFNIGALHEVDFEKLQQEAMEGGDASSPPPQDVPQTIIEVDYYYSDTLLVMSDQEIAEKAKKDLDDILGVKCQQARVVDAAIVRLPRAVNWYYPDSYKDMPDLKSQSLDNVYFAGDLVRNTEHGSWSQEKAYVAGKQVANLVLASGNPVRTSSDTVKNQGIIPLPKDEVHVALGRWAVGTFRKLFPLAPSPVDFLW